VAVYIDTSAAVKLAVAEAESQALREFLTRYDDGLVSSSLIVVEMRRAALRSGDPITALDATKTFLESIRLVRISDAILQRAGTLMPATLRSLDAIHLATALSLGAMIEGFVCYDNGLCGAALNQGIEVSSPR
jgi:uncharacterized protein